MLKTSLTMIAALAVSGLALPALAADYTIRAVANSNEADEDFDGLQVFKSYVESASNGAIAVDIYMGTQLCSNGAECLEGVASGSIDVYISTSDGAAGLFPYLQVLDLPYVMLEPSAYGLPPPPEGQIYARVEGDVLRIEPGTRRILAVLAR